MPAMAAADKPHTIEIVVQTNVFRISLSAVPARSGLLARRHLEGIAADDGEGSSWRTARELQGIVLRSEETRRNGDREGRRPARRRGCEDAAAPQLPIRGEVFER